jgi:hypothetical protein
MEGLAKYLIDNKDKVTSAFSKYFENDSVRSKSDWLLQFKKSKINPQLGKADTYISEEERKLFKVFILI